MKWRILPLLLLVAVLAAALPAYAGSSYFSANVIMRVDTQTPEDRTAVDQAGFDILSVDLPSGSILVGVPIEQMMDVVRLGFNTDVIEVKGMPSGYGPYHDYSEQHAELLDLNATYPDLTKVFSLGKSVEGRELWCIKISTNPEFDDPDKPAYFEFAQHHAREILGPELALYTAKTLLDSYGKDEQLTAYVDQHEIYVAPTVNPDGAEYDQSNNTFHMWRKNREINAGTSCIGVDLNRNYNYHWIGPGSTSGPCTETYRGPSAFSEPETQHLRDFINAHANIHMILSIHTYQKLVLYPWGYTYDPIADQTDFLAYRTLAEAMAKLNGYTPTQASGLYITNGDSDDWEYGAKGIFAFTFELEPGQLDPLGFYPPPSIIPGACKRNFEAIKLMIGLSRDPHLAVSAELWRLEATLHGHAATIHWNSVIESTPKGWNVLRAIGSSENYQPINSKLIKAGQADYQFVDDGLADGETYQYKVEFVSQYPSANVQFGPVSVTVGGGDDDVSPDDDATDDDAADDDNAATDDDQSAGGDDSGGCGC